jgi:hypothetical protein
MDLEITFNDPKYYTRPFSKAALTLLPDTDLFEYVCADNEKDRVHLATSSTGETARAEAARRVRPASAPC